MTEILLFVLKAEAVLCVCKDLGSSLPFQDSRRDLWFGKNILIQCKKKKGMGVLRDGVDEK